MRNMKRTDLFLVAGLLASMTAPAIADVVLEPFFYTQNFETREECAWASYPQWQDTAYDPNFRANTIVPGDPNVSIVQTVTPYSNVDNYAGAMKEFDAYITPGSSITLRYYLKTQIPVEYFIVRLASGPDGKLDVTFPNPPRNHWEWVTVTYTDFIRENPNVAGKDKIKVNGLAVLAKIPRADPSMPIYLGLDDVTFKGSRAMAFQFTEPRTFKLAEWKPYIPRKHFKKGDLFTLRGTWPLKADRVQLTVISYTDTAKTVLSAPLRRTGDEWSLRDYTLSWPEGLYLGTLTAYRGNEPLSDTQFTLYISPEIGGNHPRLWFDAESKNTVESRFMSDRFGSVREDIMSGAKTSREKTPVDKLVWDIDQFPDENWISTLGGWGKRMDIWIETLRDNALAYSLGGDREAGEYCKNLLVKISSFPSVLHPWMIKRGHHIYYPVGLLGVEMGLAYDLTYDLMDENERRTARDGMMRFVVEACHKGYVEDDLVISNTSNWVGHITSGSLMCQAAMYGDSPDMKPLEPYFTGALMKNHEFIQKTIDRDGEWGEGFGYYAFSMLTCSEALPALENVFKVDLSSKLNGSYKSVAWAGRFTEKKAFYFGDSSGGISPMTNWAWLLPKYKDPLLGYMYNFLKDKETFMDVLYETDDVPKKDPFDQKPVKLFRDVGTTVFKSGWGKDDFVFVMRTGPFVNHQHIDQGSFWLADGDATFIEERHGSTYYDDPIYQPWYTQPVAHSTILIDDNPQSQRVGDLLWHIDGFNDYAFVGEFLDGKNAAFSSGDIGRLYWGKVKRLARNVLYLKPRTLLMLDTVVPAEKDADVTLLYQTQQFEDITAGSKVSSITKEGATLHIMHLSPAFVEAKVVETPHYLHTLRSQNPLVREGMLTVKARTNGIPLVMANLLTTTKGAEPRVTTVESDGCVSGSADGIPFVYSTRPGAVYTANGITTDAVAVTGDETVTFAAMARTFSRGASLVMAATSPVTFETSATGFTYNSSEDCNLTLGVTAKPSAVSLNGGKVPFTWDAVKSAVVLAITKGDGAIVVKQQK